MITNSLRVFFELGTKLQGVSYDFHRFEQDVIDVMENHVTGRTLEEIDVGAFSQTWSRVPRGTR